MNSDIYHKSITNHIRKLADNIELFNSDNLNDQALKAEGIFCELLNRAFGWNLTNANREKTNQVGFDLKDAGRDIYIQVTSNQQFAAKRKTAINEFEKEHPTGPQKRFIILFIVGTVTEAVAQKMDHGSFTAEAWDMRTLLKEIYYENTTAERLQPLQELLQAETAAKIILDPIALEKLDIVPLPKSITPNKDSIKITRTKLLKDLFQFSQGGNGLVVGGPGEGKSYLLRELQRKYLAQNIPCYVVPIDSLTTGSDGDIIKELGGRGNWLNALNKIVATSPTTKNLLIFDAFDTAKDPQLKRAVLNQLKRAVEHLSLRWNILVSSRLYEATKSPELTKLFPFGDIRAALPSRYFEVPLLDVGEVQYALKKKHLLEVYNKSTPALKQLLQIPYFLSLFDQLTRVASAKTRERVEAVETEEQLLSLFWKNRVFPETAGEFLIEKIARHLSSQCKMSCPRSEIVTSGDAETLDRLIGNGIVSPPPSDYPKISFSHNILLDYAISLFVLPTEPPKLADFIIKHPRHWLLFRSSYTYRFNRLWEKQRSEFWYVYTHFLRLDDPVFRLFFQTVLNFVLASVYRSSTEIDPTFSKLDPDTRSIAYRNFLVVLRYVNKASVPGREFEFLLHISKQLDTIFVWDVGFLMDRAINQSLKHHKRSQLQMLSEAAIYYMRFYLENRTKPLTKGFMDNNAGPWAIRNVCRCYPFNRKMIAKLITSFVDILTEAEFPISIFYPLTDQLEALNKHNVRLTASLFLKIYNRVDNSTSTTTLGSDVSFPLRSSRKQDVGVLHYTLERLFPNLLRDSPEIWIAVGMKIVNDYNRSESFFLPKQRAMSFSFLGRKAGIVQDVIHYSQHYDRENGSVSFLTQILAYFSELISKNQHTLLRKLFLEAAIRSRAGSLWVEWIRLIASDVQLLKKEAYAVLTCPTLLLHDNTSNIVASLLSVAWSHLSRKQRINIEKIIATLRHTTASEAVTSQIRDRLLAQIFAPKSDSPVSKEPPSAKKDHLKLPLAPAILASKPFQDEIRLLESFNNRFEGKLDKDKEPQPHDYDSLQLTAMRLLAARMAGSIPDELRADCDYELSRFGRLVANYAKNPSGELINDLLQIAFYYLDLLQYQESDYQTGPLSGGAQGYTPTPRIDAVKTLLHLLKHNQSTQIRKSLANLFSDNDYVVRQTVLHALTWFWHEERVTFWEIVSSRIPAEENPICLQHLLGALSYVDILASDQPRAEGLAESAARILHRTEPHLDSLFRTYAMLLLRLYDSFDSKIAERILDDNLQNDNLLYAVVFIIIDFIDPHQADNTYESSGVIRQPLINLLSKIVNVITDRLKGKRIVDLTREELEPMDQIISQMYITFASGKREFKDKRPEEKRERTFYARIKPMLTNIVSGAGTIESGFMVAQTGYRLTQLLGYYLRYDTSYTLQLLTDVVRFASANHFTYSFSALDEIKKIVEIILADHAELLNDDKDLNNLLQLLDLFSQSGWIEAMELTWRIKDAF